MTTDPLRPAPPSPGSSASSGAQADVLPAPDLLSKARNRLRVMLDTSFERELAWGILGLIFLTLLLAKPPLGVRYGELAVGLPAPRDLIVPLSVEVPDETRTLAMREISRRQSSPVYAFDLAVSDRADESLAKAFESGRAGSSDLGSLPPGSPPAVNEILASKGFPKDLETALRANARAVLSQMILLRKDGLPPDRPIAVVTKGGQGRERPISDWSQILDIDAARERARNTAEGIAGLGPGERPAIGELLARLVEPTLVPDEAESTRRMEEAAKLVPTLFARLERGTVLARAGTILTPEVIEAAHAVERARPSLLEPKPLLGTLALAAILLSFLWVIPRYPGRIPRRNPRIFPKLVLLILVMLSVAWSMLWISSLVVDRLEAPFDRMDTMLYLVPVAAGGMLATLLFSGRVAMLYSVFFSVPYAILGGWDLRLLTFSLFTHCAAIYAGNHYRARTALMKAGFLVGLVGAASAVSLDLAQGAVGQVPDANVLLVDALAAFAGGAIGSAILVSFLLPICEWLFGILTDVRLLELLNLDNPLLSRLAAVAPGSYNHSLIVGTLAEAAADAIGGNSLFCRVAAVYHDVGKMMMPEYYIENQKGAANPHERLQPAMSAVVIANHVKDGIRLAREYGIPEQILAVIPQHHGTRVMTYFHEKARKQAPEGAFVDPDEYRYPGPKPQSREAAIFMLADSVEAAARTIDEPTPAKYREMIRQISGRVVLDGQFDECDLTFRDLDLVLESFIRTLTAVHHRRVEYPTYDFDRPGGQPGLQA